MIKNIIISILALGLILIVSGYNNILEVKVTDVTERDYSICEMLKVAKQYDSDIVIKMVWHYTNYVNEVSSIKINCR